MNKNGYEKEKSRRDFKFKEEKTTLERALRDWLKLTAVTNYTLFAIAMILLGIFIRLVLG